MKRDFTQTVFTLDGRIMRQVELVPALDGGEPAHISHDFTYAMAATEALTSLYQDENPTPAEKNRRFLLAMRIHGADREIEVSAEEIALLKSLIGKRFDPVVVGRSFAFLDPVETAE